MYDKGALKSYFDTLMSGYEFFKMVEMTKRRPNAYGVLEQGQKIAGQILCMSQGATVEQVQSNPALRIEEPNAFGLPQGIQQPVNVTPQPVDPLLVLTDTISKLADKVDVLTSHSKRQHSRLQRLEDDRPPVTV